MTMLGAIKKPAAVWAVDINPAQLFVLAAKSVFLKKNKMMPSFDQLLRAYPGRIEAVKRNISLLNQMDLCHATTGKKVSLPEATAKKYGVVVDDGLFILPQSGPYWQRDTVFTGQISARTRCLRFKAMDIFDVPDHFPPRSFDVIYLSDIFWPKSLAYFQRKLAGLAGLLRSKGRIISYLGGAGEYMGNGVSPGRILLQQAVSFGLSGSDQKNGYLVLEKKSGGR